MEPLKDKSEKGLGPAIAEELKRLIFSAQIQPGERLNEAALALQMGTSRGPIREAIRTLAGLGLVTAVPNRGVFVREISLQEMLEIYELRALIFGFAAERACTHLDEARRKEMGRLLADMDQACEQGEGTAYYEHNLRFHALVLELSGNRLARESYDDHVKQLHLFRRSHFNAPSNMRRSNAEHRAILEAIAKGDSKRARTLAERHVLSGRDRLLARLEQSR